MDFTHLKNIIQKQNNIKIPIYFHCGDYFPNFQKQASNNNIYLFFKSVPSSTSVSIIFYFL